MRLTAPELAARYRDGMVAEGAHVLDAGMVGTEMLYYLVGSRDLDGGLMCTASHNPKAYTGAKLVERGAVALSGDSGIGEIAALLADGLPEAPGGGSAEDVDVYAEFQDAALRVHRPGRGASRRRSCSTAATAWPARWSARCSSGSTGSTSSPPTGSPTASSPTTSPTRCCRRTAQFIIDKVREEGADLGIAWDGDADRCFFIDETGEFVDGDFLTALLAESVLQKQPGADDPLRRPRLAGGRRHRRGGRRHARSSTASATRSSRPACATRAARSAARSPATTTSPTSTTPTPARSRRC